MVVAGLGAHARRFQLTQRHVYLLLFGWLAAMLLFAYLGFHSAG